MSLTKPTVVYDPEQKIIFIDYTGLTITKVMLEQVLAEVSAITATLPQKVFVASCFTDTTIAPDLNDEWGALTADLLKQVRGVIRYGVNNGFTNITLRTTTIKNRQQKLQSHIYPTREEAIAAIRQLEQAP